MGVLQGEILGHNTYVLVQCVCCFSQEVFVRDRNKTIQEKHRERLITHTQDM